MNIKELIHDLRARINPQYYDQIGTESYERHQCVLALEYLQHENERQRFDILAMNQSLDLMREENERLRKDAERFNWIALNVKTQLTPESMRGEIADHKTMYVLPRLIEWADFCGNIPFAESVDYAISAIDAARGEK